MACACCTTGGCGCGCHSYTPAGSDGAAGRALAISRMRDRARDMYARWGLRLYSVTIVRVRATGGHRRGDGPDQVVGSWEVLPVPSVLDLQTLTQIVSPSQIREGGTVLVTGISGAYSEDTLLGRGSDGTSVPPEEAIFWEIMFNDPHGRSNTRRRMVADGAPTYDGIKAEWSLTMHRQHSDRSRQGIPRDGAR